MSRRFFWLAVTIVAAVALYTGAWFYAADRIEQQVRASLAEFSRGGGNRAVCEEPTVRGYPFRIGLFCNATYLERASAGLSMSTGSLRSAAQIYAPRRLVAEADSPARLLLPGLVPLDLTWQSLRASTRLARPLPERISIEGTGLTAIADMPNVDGPLAFTADRAELHVRPADQDLDVAIRFNGFQPGPLLLSAGRLPPLNGFADLSVEDGVEMLRDRRGAVRGVSVEIRRIEISSADGAQVTASGTASIGEDGLVDAELTLGTADAAALASVVSTAFPENGPALASAIRALAALGPSPELPLVIEKGRARMGFIELGVIPPL